MVNQYLEGLKIYKKSVCPIQNEPLAQVCAYENIYDYGFTVQLRKPERFYRDFFYAAIDNEAAYRDFLTFKTPSLYGVSNTEIDFRKTITHLTEASLFAPFYNVCSCLHYRYDVPYFHDHEFYEFTVCVAGAVCIENNGEYYTLKKGEISLTPPNVKHRVCVLDDDTLVTNILIRASTFSKIFPYVLERGGLISSFFTNAEKGKNNYKYIIFSENRDPFLAKIIHLIICDMHKISPTVADSLTRTLFEYLLSLDDKEFKTSRSFTINTNSTITLVMRYISENYKNISLHQLSDHFNYSAQHMSRIIKNETNSSFTDIVQNFKLSEACDLLKNTSIKICDISDICGFASREHFTRLFNKVYGISPSRYRTDAGI